MKNILEYLEISAKKYPEKTAIADRDKSYTFGELKNSASLLGKHPLLQNINNSPVGIFASHSSETIVMMLGVLYSGNFYVPLNPDLPCDKLSQIIGDSGMSVIIGADDAEKAKQSGFDGTYIDFSDIQGNGDSACIPDIPPTSPMFAIYTSGSTGKPKGVLKNHLSMMSFIEAYVNEFGFDENIVIGNQTPFFFDASAKDIYLMLRTGARMEILPAEFFSFPVMLIKYMNERKVSFISWVPTALSIVTKLNTFSEVLPLYLEKVFFVGEAFPAKQLKKWMTALPDVRFVNLYGSSETAGICCFCEITEAPEEDGQLPIGKPLKNCDVFLMDDGEFVTQGIGEIFVSGDSLADCYYNDDEKTQNSFFVHYMPDGSQKRVFRTGDIAKYNENGDLIFVSRRDNQIKHMGYRIELGEIEHAAQAIEGVAKACCVYNKKRQKIILVCEPAPQSTITADDIRRIIKTKLADYMHPAKVLTMEALPLNANGKTDRPLIEKIIMKEKN